MMITELKRMPRYRFNPKSYLEDTVQSRNTGAAASGSSGSMTLLEAGNLLYEHLSKRATMESDLHEDLTEAGLGDPVAQIRVKAQIEHLVSEYRLDVDPVTLIEGMNLTDSLFAVTVGAGRIEDLYKSPDVEEVQVTGRDVFVIKKGKQYPHHRKFTSIEEVHQLQLRLSLFGKKPIHEGKPVIQTYMHSGSRLVMAREPLSDVPSIQIRNFNVTDVSLTKLTREPYNTLSPDMAQFLRLIIRHHASTLVSGGTNVGKTSFLFALAQEVPEDERIITLEKEFEVAFRKRLRGMRNILALREILDSNLSMQEIFNYILVMSPKWVVVGEARGAEMAQMLEGALRGHDAMGTLHVQDREAFVSEAIAMINQDGKQRDFQDTRLRIARAFKILVFLKLITIGDKTYRIVTEITELGVDEETREAVVKPLFVWDYMERTWKRTEHSVSQSLMERLMANGANPQEFQKLGVWK